MLSWLRIRLIIIGFRVPHEPIESPIRGYNGGNLEFLVVLVTH